MQEMTLKIKLISLKFSILLLLSCGERIQQYENIEEKTTLYVSNWIELPEKMKVINSEFMKEYPDIKVEYIEYTNTIYDDEMNYQLKAGIAPDIIYLRSYDKGYEVFKTGYLATLNEIVPQLANFPEAPVKAWSSSDGEIYGVPSLGVVHGIYFNKRIFNQYGLQPPETWNQLLDTSRQLQSKGITPFSFGTKDRWVLYEVFFSGLGANFYGGEETRQKLLNKEIRITDQRFKTSIDELMKLRPFFPSNYRDIGYSQMRTSFAKGEAAMYIGGSWDITNLKENSPEPESIGFFAPPPLKKGDNLNYCFHVDIGIGMNRVTRYPEAAKKYIRWVASKDYAKTVMNQFPGFFSYTPGLYELDDNLAKEMESYIADSIPTVRTLWEKLSAESPTGNELMGIAMQRTLNSEFTPSEALNYIDSGLTWYYRD